MFRHENVCPSTSIYNCLLFSYQHYYHSINICFASSIIAVYMPSEKFVPPVMPFWVSPAFGAADRRSVAADHPLPPNLVKGVKDRGS